MVPASEIRPDAASSRRRKIILAALCSLMLSNCGWQPLYARPSPDPASGGVDARLAQISVDPVETVSTVDPLTGSDKFDYDARGSQILQNALLARLNPNGRPEQAQYHLAVVLRSLTTSSSSLSNGQSTRNDVRMTAKYQLLNEAGKLVIGDTVHTITSFDVLYQPFNDISAQNDSMRRGAEELAEMIEARLAVFLLGK